MSMSLESVYISNPVELIHYKSKQKQFNKKKTNYPSINANIIQWDSSCMQHIQFSVETVYSEPSYINKTKDMLEQDIIHKSCYKEIKNNFERQR